MLVIFEVLDDVALPFLCPKLEVPVHLNLQVLSAFPNPVWVFSLRSCFNCVIALARDVVTPAGPD